jgi:thiol:disulfide interchange protein DsbD
MIRFLHRTLAATTLLLMLAPAPARAVDEADLLPVDEAFALTVSAPARDRIAIEWKIADGYYLYRHRIAAQPVDPTFEAGPLALPAGKRKTDRFFGEVETYRGTLAAVLPGAAAPGADAVQLRIKYQGCADIGVC